MLNLLLGRARIRLFAGPKARSRMPHYEFFCLECKTFFDKILSLVDYQEGSGEPG
jgi:hypothetical protein